MYDYLQGKKKQKKLVILEHNYSSRFLFSELFVNYFKITTLNVYLIFFDLFLYQNFFPFVNKIKIPVFFRKKIYLIISSKSVIKFTIKNWLFWTKIIGVFLFFFYHPVKRLSVICLPILLFLIIYYLFPTCADTCTPYLLSWSPKPVLSLIF